MKKVNCVLLALSLLLTVALFAAAADAEPVASGICGADGDHLTWTLDANGVLTIAGTGRMESYPQGFPNVTPERTTAPWGEYAAQIKTVIVGDDVETIGDSAFCGCTEITRAQIGQNVTAIYQYAFGRCTALQSVTLPGGLRHLYAGVFSGCASLERLSLPDALTEIAPWLCFGCTSLQTVTFGKAVESIGMDAFWNCTSLAAITLPDSLRSIGTGAFRCCTALESVRFDPFDSSDLREIQMEAFYGCTALQQFEVPYRTTSISAQAFAYSGLRDLTVRSYTCKIHPSAFSANVTIHGYAGSEAEAFAERNELTFVPLSDEGDAPTPTDDSVPRPTLLQRIRNRIAAFFMRILELLGFAHI